MRSVRTDAKNERETETNERSETLTAATHHNDVYHLENYITNANLVK